MANNHNVNLENKSKYRVAYNLMKDVANYEDNETKNREYFLRLYQQ